MIGEIVVYGTLTWIGLPIPALSFVSLLVLRFKALVPREDGWLEEEKVWGPTIDIKTDE
jgi:hypothetical protein